MIITRGFGYRMVTRGYGGAEALTIPLAAHTFRRNPILFLIRETRKILMVRRAEQPNTLSERKPSDLITRHNKIVAFFRHAILNRIFREVKKHD